MEVSEISLCNISAWEIAVIPSFPEGQLSGPVQEVSLVLLPVDSCKAFSHMMLAEILELWHPSSSE